MVRQIRCVLMRGGTSKAVFLKESDLPTDEAERNSTILSIFGSPDRRQIDGLGGADPLTSKLAIIGPVRTAEPRATGTHLTYTFGQVEIAHPEIDWLSLCGNISSAVGAFAVYEGYVTPSEPVTQVRVFNTNLYRVLTIEVPVGRAPARTGRLLRFPACPEPEPGSWSISPTPPAPPRRVASDRTAGRSPRCSRRRRDRCLAGRYRQRARVRARRDLGLRGTESAAQLDAEH